MNTQADISQAAGFDDVLTEDDHLIEKETPSLQKKALSKQKKSPPVQKETPSSHEQTSTILTELTTLEIYPHTETPFHYFMGFLTFLFIVPLKSMLFPFMIFIKSVLYAPLSLFLNEKIWGRTLVKGLTFIKNTILLPFHYIMFKVHYIYGTIWMACFHKQDDYWYGVDMAPYRDYEDYVSSFRTSKVRWRFKKKLKTYSEYGIEEIIVPDHLVFFKVLFSRAVFRLIKESTLRKNEDIATRGRLVAHLLRDYSLLLFVPVRLHLYEKDGRVIGLSTYLKKGNTIIMCQHIIADDFNRSCVYYHQMDQCFKYAFGDPRIKYISCALTTGQSKQTCGCHPMNYLLTDEFKFIPFSAF